MWDGNTHHPWQKGQIGRAHNHPCKWTRANCQTQIPCKRILEDCYHNSSTINIFFTNGCKMSIIPGFNTSLQHKYFWSLTSKLFSLISNSGMACVSSLQEYPMLMAVSCLSPVKIQIFTSALLRFAILSGTLWNKKWKWSTSSSSCLISH